MRLVGMSLYSLNGQTDRITVSYTTRHVFCLLSYLLSYLSISLILVDGPLLCTPCSLLYQARSNASDSRYRMADTAVLDAEAKKRKRDSTPEHLRVQPVDPEEKLLRSDEPRIRHREAASSAWTLQLPRPLVSLLRDLCERRPVEHFITVRAVAHGRSINLSGRWTVETSHGSSHVLPRWMQEPELLRPEQDGELMVTMHTHPRAAITQSLDTVPSLRRRQQLARTNPLLYVPSLADVNNMLRYGMHASTVRRRPGQSPSSAAASPRRRAWRLWAARHSQGERSDHWAAASHCLGCSSEPPPRSPTPPPLARPGTCTSSPRPSIGSSATCPARARPPSWRGICRRCWPRAKATSRRPPTGRAS